MGQEEVRAKQRRALEALIAFLGPEESKSRRGRAYANLIGFHSPIHPALPRRAKGGGCLECPLGTRRVRVKLWRRPGGRAWRWATCPASSSAPSTPASATPASPSPPTSTSSSSPLSNFSFFASDGSQFPFEGEAGAEGG